MPPKKKTKKKTAKRKVIKCKECGRVCKTQGGLAIHMTSHEPNRKIKMGRKEKPIDLTELNKLAVMQCTNTEIAAFFDVDEKTIRNRFSEQIAKGKEAGKMSIRHEQYNTMKKGNVTMQIWLGKNYLNQSDKLATETSLSINDLADIMATVAGMKAK